MGSPATPLVRVEGVSKAYRAAGPAVAVLDGVSLTLTRGETTSLIGVSGSGKSTLLALLAGLLRPDSGRIVFDGQDLAGLDEGGLARLRARRIGVVLQSGNLVPFLTALENVKLAVRLGGGRPGAAHGLLAQLGLEPRLHHLPRRLSGGEAQRVAVAVALANAPGLLLADEVTGELDAVNAAEVMGAIFGAARDRGVTVLFVTHDAGIAAQADRGLRLAEGTVQAA